MSTSAIPLTPALLAEARRLGAAHGGDEQAVLAAAVCAALWRYDQRETHSLGLAGVGAIAVPTTADTRFGDLVATVAELLDRPAATEPGVWITLPAPDSPAGFAVEGPALPNRGDARWVDSLGCLLRDALARPQAPLTQLRMLDPQAARAQAAAQSERAAGYRQPACHLLHAGFERAAAEHPKRIALVSDTGELSYRELDERAERYAAFLRSQGCGPERTVGVHLDRSAGLVVALLAVLKAGAAFVPLDRRLPAARIAAMLASARCELVVSQEELRPALAGTGARVVTEADAPADIATGSDRFPLLPDHPAFVYYTSGSTGTPKGVVLDHRNAAARVEWIVRRYRLGPDSVVLHKTPLIFDVAIIELFAPLGVGGTVRIVAPQAEADVGYLADVLSGDRVSFVHFVPSMLKTFLAGVGSTSFPSVRWLQTSGEAMPARLLTAIGRTFPGARVDCAYGQTETSEVAVWSPGDGEPGTSTVPVGAAVAAYRLLLLDSALQPVPDGVPGEICVAGVGGLARCYAGRPAETAERFVPNPYPAVPGERLYRTGDLAMRPAPEAPLEFLGRADQQRKIRGARVELAEIEAALAGLAGIRDCAVIVRSDEAGDDELIAYLVGEQIPATELSRVLPDYMMPAAFVLLAELPYTPSGKLDRGALPAPTAAERAARGRGEQPVSQLEAEIASDWARGLGVDTVGRSDSFFDLGGNSLKAAQMLTRISALFGVRIPVVAFFRDPTVHGVSTEVERLVVEAVDAMPADEVELRLAGRGSSDG